MAMTGEAEMLAARKATLGGRKIKIISDPRLSVAEIGPDIEDLSTVLYYPFTTVKENLPIITDHPELQPGEQLRVLIRKEVISARIATVSRALETIISQDPENYVTGAILNGGDYFRRKAQELWSPELRSQVVTADVDIKSRIVTRTGEYRINLLPRHDVINHKTYIVFEGVADSTYTLQLLQEALAKEPYQGVELRVILLVDKTDAHLGIPLPECVWHCLFAMEKEWMAGCGPDWGERLRELEFVVVCEGPESC